MKKSKIVVVCFMVAALLVGCLPSKIFNAPQYSTYSFSPNSATHRLCAYNGNEYFYYDLENEHSTPYGSDGTIYRIKQGELPSVLIENIYVNERMVVDTEYLYYWTHHRIFQVNLKTGEEKATPEKYHLSGFGIDAGIIFASGYFDIELEDDRRLFMFDAEYINKEPELFDNIVKSLDGFEKLRLQNTPYASLWDNERIYFYKTDSIRYMDVFGIFNKESENRVYSFSTDSELSVWFRGSKLLTTDRQSEGSGSYLNMSEEGAFIEKYISFPPKYRYMDNNFIEQDGVLYALLQKEDYNGTVGEYNLPQNMHESDMLVAINPDDGSYEILYETKSKEERIVGYWNETIYLFEKNSSGKDRIYRLDTDSGEKKELCKIEKRYKNYTFELCGEKLFVWGGENQTSTIFVGAYDLK
jgi:hypothetical protein